jgi:hypothetical protein
MELLSPRMIEFLGIEERRGAKELLEYNLHTLRILGLWKWDVPQWRIHRAFAFLTIISLILFEITLICDAYINITDLENLAKLLLSSIFIGLVAFKNAYLLVRIDDASKLINDLQNKFFISEELPLSQQTVILNRYAARAKLYTIIRRSVAFGLVIFWLSYPIKEMLGGYAELLDAKEDSDDMKSISNKTFTLQLPWLAYFPYDTENNLLYFILTYIFQAFCGLSVFIELPAWDMLFVSVFIHTSGHFKSLQHILIHLREDATKALEVDKNQRELHETFQISEQIGNDGNSMWKILHSEEHAEGKSSFLSKCCDTNYSEIMNVNQRL